MRKKIYYILSFICILLTITLIIQLQNKNNDIVLIQKEQKFPHVFFNKDNIESIKKYKTLQEKGNNCNYDDHSGYFCKNILWYLHYYYLPKLKLKFLYPYSDWMGMLYYKNIKKDRKDFIFLDKNKIYVQKNIDKNWNNIPWLLQTNNWYVGISYQENKEEKTYQEILKETKKNYEKISCDAALIQQEKNWLFCFAIENTHVVYVFNTDKKYYYIYWWKPSFSQSFEKIEYFLEKEI